MNRNALIRFIRRNNRFYAKGNLSFYTDEQLIAIMDRIIRSKMTRPAS
jgi:hypothetical protein